MIKGNRTQLLFDIIKEKEISRILDVGNLGCGGAIHDKLVEMITCGEVFGLDITDQKSVGKNYGHQYQGRAEEMPFDDNFFDVVYMGEVIEHTWHPFEVLSEIHRVLRPDGLLVFDTPNIYSLSRMVRYLIKGRDITIAEPGHKIFFSRAVLETLLSDAGFEILTLTTDNKFTIKGRTFVLPKFGSFNFMGEHLLVSAKNNK